MKFPDKNRHQIFIEPESLSLDTMYIQGFSSSLPRDIQEKMVKTLPGFENAVIKKYAYAIEYDAIDPLQMKPTLESMVIENLYTAGQINGTSGYEEAAGQGLIAGINAINKLTGKPDFILKRDEAYIGVMIDDLVTKGTQEPYRLLTSRAEFRLLLRHDNADQRLTEKAREFNLIKDEVYQSYKEKMNKITEGKKLLEETKFSINSEVNELLENIGYERLSDGISALELLKRPNVTCMNLQPYLSKEIEEEIGKQIDIEVKYEGYITKAKKEANKLLAMDNVKLPEDLDYNEISNLSLEGRQKLSKIKPITIGQASRISGVDPSDIAILAMVLEQRHRKGS